MNKIFCFAMIIILVAGLKQCFAVEKSTSLKSSKPINSHEIEMELPEYDEIKNPQDESLIEVQIRERLERQKLEETQLAKKKIEQEEEKKEKEHQQDLVEKNEEQQLDFSAELVNRFVENQQTKEDEEMVKNFPKEKKRVFSRVWALAFAQRWGLGGYDVSNQISPDELNGLFSEISHAVTVPPQQEQEVRKKMVLSSQTNLEDLKKSANIFSFTEQIVSTKKGEKELKQLRKSRHVLNTQLHEIEKEMQQLEKKKGQKCGRTKLKQKRIQYMETIEELDKVQSAIDNIEKEGREIQSRYDQQKEKLKEKLAQAHAENSMDEKIDNN